MFRIIKCSGLLSVPKFVRNCTWGCACTLRIGEKKMIAHGQELAHAGWVEERCALKIACAYKIAQGSTAHKKPRAHASHAEYLAKTLRIVRTPRVATYNPLRMWCESGGGKKNAHCAARAATRAPPTSTRAPRARSSTPSPAAPRATSSETASLALVT